MEIKELSFKINDRAVRIGEKVRMKVRCENDEYILEGEIRGAYQGKNDEWCIFVMGKYQKWIDEELSMHGIYLSHVLGLKYLKKD